MSDHQDRKIPKGGGKNDDSSEIWISIAASAVIAFLRLDWLLDDDGLGSPS